MAEITSNKETFFRELDQLDYLTDDSQDKADEAFAHLMVLSRGRKEKPHSPVASHPKSPPPLTLSRANTAPQSSSTSTARSGVDKDISSVKRSKTTGNLSDPVEAEAPIRKRKRTLSSRTVPEEQRIFRGLVFFFFPNNDVSPLRRLRIQRAQEYGALWAKTWGDRITHVIVDKGLSFEEVTKHLKLVPFPPNVALLDESYPSECINFRSVLSTTLARFRVKGTPVLSEVQVISSTEPSSTGSLPLKPARGEQAQTPTQTQSSNPRDKSGLAPDQHVDVCPKVCEEKSVCEPPARERDALDDMIDAAKIAKDLPLDPLGHEDEGSIVGASDTDISEVSDSEPNNRKRKPSLKKDDVVDAWQQKFACMQKHDLSSKSENPNSRTIEVLQQMLDYYTRTSDQWRVLAYRKAISALRRQPKKIITRRQARSIPGIGERLADKIEEIVFTNRLRRLENANNTAEDHILQVFLGVYGAGISQASQWIAQGYKSLEDLKTKASLTKSQRIGVEHYYNFAQRIPQREVEAHGEIVRRAVEKVNPKMQVIISGSYRRGAADSGDIDLLITEPDATIEQIRALMMDVVVPHLFEQGFLKVSLASTSRSDGSKWHGASALPGSSVWRRIDLLFVPGSEIGAALIYFTGNDIFNRSMRLLASKKGMRLNQRGLYADVLRGPQRKKLTEGRLLEGRDERRIFEILGVPWRPPEHRIC